MSKSTAAVSYKPTCIHTSGGCYSEHTYKRGEPFLTISHICQLDCSRIPNEVIKTYLNSAYFCSEEFVYKFQRRRCERGPITAKSERGRKAFPSGAELKQAASAKLPITSLRGFARPFHIIHTQYNQNNEISDERIAHEHTTPTKKRDEL